MTKLNKTTRESLQEYSFTLRLACRDAGDVEPLRVLTDTDDYPQVAKQLPDKKG